MQQSTNLVGLADGRDEGGRCGVYSTSPAPAGGVDGTLAMGQKYMTYFRSV
jgi:hypothetical protein